MQRFPAHIFTNNINKKLPGASCQLAGAYWQVPNGTDKGQQTNHSLALPSCLVWSALELRA